MAICHTCHKEFPGTSYNCTKCAIDKCERARYRRLSLEKKGLCNICGGRRGDKYFKACKKCRDKGKLKLRKQRNEKNETEILNTDNVIRIIKEACYNNSMSKYDVTKIVNEVEMKMDLMGYKQSPRKAVV